MEMKHDKGGVSHAYMRSTPGVWQSNDKSAARKELFPPLSRAIFVCLWRPINILRVNLWWMYKLIGELPSNGIKNRVSAVGPDFPANNPFVYHPKPANRLRRPVLLVLSCVHCRGQRPAVRLSLFSVFAHLFFCPFRSLAMSRCIAPTRSYRAVSSRQLSVVLRTLRPSCMPEYSSKIWSLHNFAANTLGTGVVRHHSSYCR